MEHQADRRGPRSRTPRRLTARGLTLSPRAFALRTDHDLAYLAAIRAGLGIGACQAPLAARSPILVPVSAQRALRASRLGRDARRPSRGAACARRSPMFDHLA
ncbi:MAG: hypothetical protein R3B99_16500 [Polyangiales bacterium]